MNFQDIPTTKYLRPWWFAVEEILDKESAACSYEIGFDYVKRFYDTYKMNKKFALMVSSTASRNDLNSVGVIDKNIIDL